MGGCIYICFTKPQFLLIIFRYKWSCSRGKSF